MWGVETLADIYFGRHLAEYRRIDLFEKCVGCPLHGWCRGCPAVAFGYTGDHHAPDPQCWYGLA